MLVLSQAEVRQTLSMTEAISVVEGAYAAYSAGLAEIPVRTQVPVGAHAGIALFMPAYVGAVSSQDDEALGVKIVSVFPNNLQRGLPTILGLVVMLDPVTGRPLAAMEASYLTALRTGAASGVATKYLARSDASRVAVFGAGVQARTQLEAVAAVRRLEHVYIFDVEAGRAAIMGEEMKSKLGPVGIEVAESPAQALQGRDIIITATTAAQPVFPAAQCPPGVHINAIGAFTPKMQEVPAEIIKGAGKVVVDSREAAWAEAGDLIIPLQAGVITRERVDAEIGEIILGRKKGRENPEEVTVFKAVGIAALDAAVGRAIFQRAREMGLGTEVEL